MERDSLSVNKMLINSSQVLCFLAKVSITFWISIVMFLWVYIKANTFILSWDTVLLKYVFSLLIVDTDLSHVHVVIGNTPRSFSAV